MVRDKPGSGASAALSAPPVSSAPDADQVASDASSLVAEARYADALALVDRALMATPEHPALLLAKGSTLYEWGRAREARDVLLRAEASSGSSTPACLRLGWACLSLGSRAEAQAWMRKAVLAEPGGWQGHFGLGVVLLALGRSDEAAASLESCLERNPDHVDSLVFLGGCKLDQEKPGEAEALLRRAIALDGKRADIRVTLALAIGRQGRIDDAREALERAERLDAAIGTHAGDPAILGEALMNSGHLRDALDLYERSLPEWPTIANHFNYAIALLTSGRLPEGWHHYEFRWLKEPFLSRRPQYGRPPWSGQDLNGKTILLHGEQGSGDTIQFLRYAQSLKLLGATVVLHGSEGLVALARGCPGVDVVLDAGDPLPPFDFYIHLMSLPRIFGTEIDSIPNAVPYLNVEPALAEQWARRLDADPRPRVGIVWAGSPGHLSDRWRSMPLHALAPLGELAEVRFISLQKGAAAAAARAAALPLPLLDLDPELEDFSDTAAVISQLDLVISVDTAVVHLAGALGRPVWTMVAEPADWRWLTAREDSPWYPTMRLFRQRRRGDWDELVARVKVALQERFCGVTKHPVPGVGQPATASQQPTPARLPSPHVGPRVAPGFCAVAETRVGILEYRPDLEPVGQSIGWYGEYRQADLDLLATMVDAGATVLEVGAGVGAHAVFLAKIIGDAGHLILYEPGRVRRRILETNVGANRLSNVTVMRRRLGRPRERGAGAPAQGSAPAIGVGGDATETLDQLRLARLDLLKVNADHEDDVSALEVLSGAADTLWRLRPTLFLAAKGEAALHDLADCAKGFGYRCWRIETALFNPANFNRRETDIFGGRAALALMAVPEECDVDRVPQRHAELR